MLPNISSDQEIMANKILRGILSTPDDPTFQENIINPEIIQELPSNYDSLKKKFFATTHLILYWEIVDNNFLEA